jgi:CheY-like chemotaxis protein
LFNRPLLTEVSYEVCGRLKADERTRDMPVIFISAVDCFL